MTPATKPSPPHVAWDDLKWLIPLLLAVLSMFGSSFVAYTNNDKVIAKEITTLQERQSSLERQRIDDMLRLIRIEDKVDRLIERGIK